MRTLLIAPSFMAVFAVAIVSIGWLIMAGGDNTIPDYSAMPSRDAFFAWAEQYPTKKPISEQLSETVREQLEELGQF